MITNLFICSKSFPHFLFFLNIQQGSTWNGCVKDEEISTFWHGHRNRCLIFLCEVRWKQKGTFLKSYFCCLNIYGYNQQNSKIERKNKKRNVGRNFEKKQRLAECFTLRPFRPVLRGGGGGKSQPCKIQYFLF